jgi:hypothetical protein
VLLFLLERQRDRETERERDYHRQTDRQTDRERERLMPRNFGHRQCSQPQVNMYCCCTTSIDNVTNNLNKTEFFLDAASNSRERARERGARGRISLTINKKGNERAREWTNEYDREIQRQREFLLGIMMKVRETQLPLHLNPCFCLYRRGKCSHGYSNTE